MNSAVSPHIKHEDLQLKTEEPLTPKLTVQYKNLLSEVNENKQSSNSHIKVARFLLRLKKFKKAISSLKVAKSLNPSETKVYLMLGWALQQSCQHTQAYLCYKQLLTRYKNSVAGNFQTASVLIQQNKPQEAISFLKKTIELHPQSRRSLAILASIAKKNNDLNRALSYIDSLIEKSPNDPDLHFQTGQIHYLAGRPSRAVTPLKNAIKIKAGHEEASKLLSKILIEEGVPTEALKIVNTILKKDGTNHEFKLLEGQAYNNIDDKDKAIACFITASKQQPSDFRSHLALGQIYQKHSELAPAEHEFIEALKLGPEQAQVYQSLSKLYLQSGQQKKAEKILIEMSEIFLLSPEPWKLLGELKLSQDNSVDSIKAFTKAIEKAPDDAALYCSRAKGSILNGAYDDAIEDFNKARNINPEIEAAKREQDLIANHKNFMQASEAFTEAEIARENGNIDLCRKHYERALKLAPDNKKWLKTFGQLSIYCGKFNDAIFSFEKLAAISGTKDPASLYQLGNFYFELNNYEKAFISYEKSATLNPLFMPARFKLIETLGHRFINNDLSPDRFPKILAAYESELTNPSRQSIAHLELAWLYLHAGSQILPFAQWTQTAACNFEAIGTEESKELTRFKYIGLLNLQNREQNYDAALETLWKLTNIEPENSNYAIALLEFLKFLKYNSRGLRMSETLLKRFPQNGLIMAMNLEFFVLNAIGQANGQNLCRKRLNEIQRLLLKTTEKGEDYLLLGLAYIILEPEDQKFASGKKAVTALNKAKTLLQNNPWPLWALVREQLKRKPAPQNDSKDEIPKEVTAICKQGLRQFPDFVPFIELLGKQMIKSKDPVTCDQGKILLERAILIDSDSPGSIFALANHYKICGNATTVRHYYERILNCTRGRFYGAKVQKQLIRFTG